MRASTLLVSPDRLQNMQRISRVRPLDDDDNVSYGPRSVKRQCAKRFLLDVAEEQVIEPVDMDVDIDEDEQGEPAKHTVSETTGPTAATPQLTPWAAYHTYFLASAQNDNVTKVRFNT